MTKAIRQRKPLLVHPGEIREWPGWRKAAFVGFLVLLLASLVHEILSPYHLDQRQLGRLILKGGGLGLFYWLAFRWKPVPLTMRKLQRFHKMKRGYYSLGIICFLLFLSLFAELLMNSRALMVKYEGQIYFPTYTAYHPGTDFGLDYQYETNYRDLRDKFRAEDKGNWVLMPIVPFNPVENDYREGIRNPAPPDFERGHYLGTDKTGRDILARLFYGFRIVMVFTLVYMFFVYLIGIALGCSMGFFGGKFDLFGLRLMEIWSAIPFLFMVIIAVSLIPSGMSSNAQIIIVMFIMVLFSWTSMAFYMRSITYKEKERDYVAAARVSGASTSRIIFQHVVPNTIATIISFLPFNLVAGITAITALDYLGFGLPVPTPSWGEMLEQGKFYLEEAPWILWSTFIAMVTVLTLVTFVGESIRDAFDPKKFTVYR